VQHYFAALDENAFF